MLARLFRFLFDRHRDRSWGTLTTGPLDEEPPVVRNWGDGIAKVRELHPDRPRPMDKPRARDEGGMDWPRDDE